MPVLAYRLLLAFCCLGVLGLLLRMAGRGRGGAEVLVGWHRHALLALGGAGLFIPQELDMALPAYVAQAVQFLAPADILHGVGKAAIFGVLIALVAASNGSGASGGAAGVGRVTTQSVVQGITAIVLADMLFVFAATR